MQPGLHAAYFLGLVLAVAIQQPADQQVVSTEQLATSADTARFIGSDSCAQCHKDGHDLAAYQAAGKEYAIWANRDPHSTAYSVLFDEQSKVIAKNLKLRAPPHKHDLCLNCHATNPSNQQLAWNSQHTVTDGVGCESCHGPAEKWLVPHQLDDWKYLSPSQKNALGFLDTSDFATRARNCAECHVGSEGRDVNHDLIAAGHPRLYFEMSAYQSKMPRHWSRAKDLAQNSETTEAKLWLVGQYVSAAAALKLLNQRVTDANSPWPEFAEYNCASCHHDLSIKRGEKDGFFASAASQPAWGTWHFSMLESLAKTSREFDSGDISRDMERLRQNMQRSLPDKNAIGQVTVGLSKHCERMADYYSHTTLSEQQAVALIGSATSLESMNWDGLTQRYLAAVALRQSQLDSLRMRGQFSASGLEISKRALLEIRDALRFIERCDGPRDLDTEQHQRLEQNFDEVFHALREGGEFGSPVILNRGTR